MSNYIVIRSKLIASSHEAIDYYAARVAGERAIDCHGRPVVILFEREGTHLFSEGVEDPSTVGTNERVVRRVAGGRVEQRRFSLRRARLLDDVAAAIARYTVSIPGTGQDGAAKRMLHGPRLPDGDYLRVVLRPGPHRLWTCVTAYPVAERVWLDACRSRRAKFPP